MQPVILSTLIHALIAQAAPTAAAAASTPAAPLLESKSLIGYIAAGGIVAIILLLLSATALALIIAGGLMMRRSTLARPGDTESIEALLRERRIDQAIQFCRSPDHDSVLSRVVAAGLIRARSSALGVLEAKPVMEEAGRQEADRIDRIVYSVRVVADLAPMLGLLGTVIGIIKAFATIGGGDAGSRSAQLSANMSEALVNTALGLAIAIPCLVTHAFFKRRAEARLAEVASTAERLISVLQHPPVNPRPAAQQSVPLAVAPSGIPVQQASTQLPAHSPMHSGARPTHAGATPVAAAATASQYGAPGA